MPPLKLTVRTVLVALLILGKTCGIRTASGDSIDLSAFQNNTELDPAPIQVDGQDTKVWQTSSENPMLTFRGTARTLAPSTGALYLQVTYLDRGYGRLAVHYRGSDGKSVKPDKFTRMVLSDS